MPQLTKKELQVIDVRQETPDTKTITLAIGSIACTYKPGQYIHLHLTTNESTSRPFSLASSPTDNGKLIVATKLSDGPFKQAINELKPADTIKVSGPFGIFTLHENNQRPAVMLSDGIGITPLRSMIK